MCSTARDRAFSELAAASGAQPRLPWQSRLVRDLAWAIGSPPLVRLDNHASIWPDAGWYRQQLGGFVAPLAALDADPQARTAALAAGRDKRLGSYFEALLALWLQRDPRFDLLARNLAIRQPRKGGGRETLGELDMLVRNHLTGQVEHWEVAVKFYLGRLQGAGDVGGEWVGPGLKDRLDIKVARLTEHQLELPAHARTQSILNERGLAIQASRVIMKGRLFYPLTAPLAPPAAAGPNHLRGWWLRVSDFPGPLKGKGWSWRCLTRREWLAPVVAFPPRARACYGASDFAGTKEIAAATWPRMVVALSSGCEVTRGFLVPDCWEAQSKHTGEAGLAQGQNRAPGEAGS